MPANDDKLERLLGRILRIGVILSSASLLAGLLLSYAPVPPSAGAALLRAGIVLLFATPASRVAASAISYFISRDWLFVALTSVVLIELGAAVGAAFRSAGL